MARYVVKLAKNAGIVFLFVIAAFLGTISGVLFAFAGDLPAISALDDYAPSTITRVYASRGELVGEFSTQRRVVVPYEAISPKLRQAIIAAEDADFERHFGLSIQHIFIAATKAVAGTIRVRAAPARSPSSWRAGCSPRQSATRSAT
jgi:penicillin-binding protein 1A